MLSLSARLALLPVTLRLAQRSLEAQALLKKLEPALLVLRRKHKDDPQRLLQETAELHRRHGVRLVDGRSLLALMLQVPLFLGLFAAVRRGLSASSPFLWIKDLMKADPLLACIGAGLALATAALAPSNVPESQRMMSMLLPALLTLVFLWTVSAGVGLYSVSASLVGVLQSWLIRRRLAQASA